MFCIMALIYGAVSTMFCHYGIAGFTAPCRPCFTIMALIFCLAFSTVFSHYGTDLGRRMRRVAHVLSLGTNLRQ